MSEENKNSEFNEKFETIEETLKYIADTQAKMEWLHKKNQIEREKFETASQKRWERTQKQLDYITKLTGIAFEEIKFQENKLQEAGKSFQKKKSKK